MDERTPLSPWSRSTERESLRRWLDYHRDTRISKVQGVDPAGLASSPVGTGTSLGGLIRHMGDMESYWFRSIFVGQPVPDRWEDPWAPDDELTADQLIEHFEEVCAVNRTIERAGGSLEQRAVGDVRGTRASLRSILQHVIEEEARHNGHADLLCELVDGEVGD